MIRNYVLCCALVMPCLLGATVIDLPATGDFAEPVRAAIPMGSRFTYPDDPVLHVSGDLTLNLPPLDPLRRGPFVRKLHAFLRESSTLDFSNATLRVFDAAGESVRWDAPITTSNRVMVPWPISLFYADKLGRTLRAYLPAEALLNPRGMPPLRVTGELVFDVSAVPLERRASIEAQIRAVLSNPQRPGVKDPVDVSEAIVRFTEYGKDSRYYFGAFLPKSLKYSIQRYGATDADHLVSPEFSPPPRPEWGWQPIMSLPVEGPVAATTEELAHLTLISIAKSLDDRRYAPSVVYVSDANVHPGARLEFRRALLERWNRGLTLDGQPVDLSTVNLQLKPTVDHCGSRMEK